MRKFCAKHSTILSVFGVHALNLHNNPAAYRKDVLVLDVRPLPGYDEAPGYYCVVDAWVEPLSNYGPEYEAMILKDLDVTEVHRKNHRDGDECGGFFAMIKGPPGLTIAMPLIYTKCLYKCDREIPWKQKILDEMNKGAQPPYLAFNYWYLFVFFRHRIRNCGLRTTYLVAFGSVTSSPCGSPASVYRCSFFLTPFVLLVLDGSMYSTIVIGNRMLYVSILCSIRSCNPHRDGVVLSKQFVRL